MSPRSLAVTACPRIDCRRYFLRLLMLAGFWATAASGEVGWYVQTSPVPADLRGVDFVDADRGWICGMQGVILHTTDGGANWIQQASGTTLNLTGISFADAQTGYAVGDYSLVLRTTNGGTSWEAVVPPQPYTFPRVAVHAANALDVWTANNFDSGGSGGGGNVAWSHDAGETWNGNGVTCYDPPHTCGTAVTGIWAPSAGTAFVAGHWIRYDYSTYGRVWRTTDGGATFQTVYSGGWTCRGVQFLTPQIGFAIDDGFMMAGEIARTDDSGDHWAVHETALYARGLSFANEMRGWIVGADGGIARTTDGGTTWSLQESGSASHLYAVDFANPWCGTAVGNAGTILHTVTGGESSEGVDAGVHRWAARLLGATPNPTSGRARVSFELAQDGTISLEIFDASGRLRRTLDRGHRYAGRHALDWDGADDTGRALPPGAYFLRLGGASVDRGQRVVILE